MIKSILLLGLLSLAFAQNIPPCVVSCQVAGSVTGCPPRSTCRNISPDGTTPRLVCVCDIATSASCSQVNGGATLSCSGDNTTSSTGCGTAFPNGCPTGATCVSSSTSNQRTCVCNTVGAVLDPVNFRCIAPCPPYSVRTDTGACQCVAPYVRDTSVNELRCILSSGATCTNVQCPLNYHCEVPSVGGPVCVPNPNSQVCGVDFRCPSPYVCVDTSSGPQCRCPEGFAGPGCAYRRCWNIQGNNDLGCWTMQNGSATCIVSTTEVPYCRCSNNLLPPDCQSNDGQCSTVDCSSIPNSRCVSGRCVCQEGFIAAPSTTNPNTFTCRQVGTCNCTGNTVCDSTLRCVCPADRFGGADCSRPACSTDGDCTTAGLVHSYCVTNTNTGVRGYCICAPGYTGERCDTATDNTCNPTRCPTANMVCNNENRCVCAPGYNGTNCTRPVTPSCISISIVVRASSANTITADQLRAVLAAFIGVDQSVINVTGPISVPGNASVVVFVIRICRDTNTNEQSAGDQFVDDVNSGSASAYGIESASVGEFTGQASSDTGASAIISLSVFLLCIAAMIA